MNGKKAKRIRRMLRSILPPDMQGTEQGAELLKHLNRQVKNTLNKERKK